MPREQLPGAGRGEYYWADLIGLRVVNTQQEELGRVARIIETGANDVLVVTADGGSKRAQGDEHEDGSKLQEAREILIPFIADAIKAVDVAAGVIAVDWGRDY